MPSVHARTFDAGNDLTSQKFVGTCFEQVAKDVAARGASGMGGVADAAQTMPARSAPAAGAGADSKEAAPHVVVPPVDAGAQPSSAAGAKPEAKPRGGRKSAAGQPKETKRKSAGGAREAAAAGGSSKKQKGRPPRDSLGLLRTGLRDLKQSGPSSKFVSSEWKNVKRNWDNYLKDIGELMEAEEDMGLVREMQLVDKQATAAKKVLQKISTDGLSSKETLETYESQMTFLGKD